MKKVMIITIGIILGFVLSIYSAAANNAEETLYPINCESEVWKTFNTHDEMVEACKIDAEILEYYMTEDLLIVVLEYPLIGDILAYDSPIKGIEQVSGYCTALELFIQRSDATEIVENAKSNIEVIKSKLNAPEVSIAIAPLIIEDLYNYLVPQQVMASSTSVYTPRGTSVYVEIHNELDYEELNETDNYFISYYPNATVVCRSTYKFNCHSYAWYSATTSNIYWMPNSNSYRTDGSYTQVTSISNASRLYYYQADHSGRVYSVSPSGLAASSVISKWGYAPLMIHTTYYCPYGSNVTLWR